MVKNLRQPVKIVISLGNDDMPDEKKVEAPADGINEQETHGGLLLEIREGDGRGSD